MNPQSATRAWLSARMPLALGALAALALLAGGALWASVVPLAGALVAEGEVDGMPQTHAVQHAEGGLVVAVLVRDGETVIAGDTLMRLDARLLDEEWHLIEAQLHEAEARAQRLRAERDGAAWNVDEAAGPAEAGQHRLFRARAATLARQAEQLDQRRLQTEAELSGLAAQADALNEEGALVASELLRHRALRDRGLASADRLAALERDAVQLAGRAAALQARRAELRGQIAEIALQGEALLAARREEAEQQLAETSVLLLELASRRAVLAERRARLDLRAPVAGRVHALRVTTPGAVLAPGETVASIIPPDAAAQINLRLRPDDIDRVYPGQDATLRLSAFAPSEVPDLPARVRDVSAAGLIDERSGARYFRATLDLTEAGHQLLEGRSLVPGMVVQGFINTGSRTAFDYLMAPVRAQMRSALREP